MAGLFGWLSELINWLGAWIPRLLVLKITEAGVKYVHGKHVVPIGPGLHVYWPAVTKIESTAVVNQLSDLSEQKMTTGDDRTVLVSGIVEYSIEDILKFLVHNENSFSNIDNAAGAAIEEVVSTTPYHDLRMGRKKLRSKLKRAVQRELARYGVKVALVRLTDFAPCTVVCVSGVSIGVNVGGGY